MIQEGKGKVLFVDDEKFPEWFNLPRDTHHARTYQQAVAMWSSGNYNVLYLDYDLNDGMNGADLLNCLCTKKVPEKVYCISINQTGGINSLKTVCEIGWKVPFEDIGRKMMFERFTILDGQGG
ncbi:MAG TPA: cyclic-phosphate processing receiver domain-containing protein [Ignavibacteriales bacterium]|nr:cyclic-phosphate processing receiver domain-containing protein [Ignavibacteriales bacterium]